jgi:hypothetical protein
MKGESDGSAVPAIAGQMKEKTQGNSHANCSFQRFIGIFDGSNYPNRMQGCKKKDANPILKMEIIFPKSLARPARWVRFTLPNENWAPWRVWAMLTRV